MLIKLGCTIIGPAIDIDLALALADHAIVDIALLEVNLNGRQSSVVAEKLAARGTP